MALDFKLKDVLHSIVAQFRKTTLPNAKKPYNLHAAEQPALDIHGIASKADVYNIAVSPKVIEEGFSAAIELLYYLVADGYKINTPLFDVHIRIPGEYDGTETHLPEGVKPEAALNVSPEFRKYLAETVQVSILGKEDLEGSIAAVTDMVSGSHDTLTRGSVISVEGAGLKIAYEAAHEAECGLWLVNAAMPTDRAKFALVIDNEPRCIKAQVPASSMLSTSAHYFLEVVTQSSARSAGGTLLKNVRSVRSDVAFQIA